MSPNRENTIQGLIKKNEVLREKHIVTWHDVISNSISENKNNWCPLNKCYHPLNTPQLIQTIKDLNQPDIGEEIEFAWRQDARPVTWTEKNRHSDPGKSKQLDPKEATECWVTLRALTNSSWVINRATICRYGTSSQNLRGLIEKVCSNEKKPNKKQKDRIENATQPLNLLPLPKGRGKPHADPELRGS